MDRHSELLRLERRIGRLSRRADRIANRGREQRRIMRLAAFPEEILDRLRATAARRSHRSDELTNLCMALHYCWMAVHDRRLI